jgi:two-component system nitrogen regulation response regulator NtrX
MVKNTIDKVAPSGSRVLIEGPPGSGKEVVARLIHRNSKRSNGAFIIINAATMSPENMENELFGVEENDKVIKTGLFEQAHGGTLFIDEVADMPQTTQAKILRVLTDQSFERVGGTTNVQVNVRVISATSRNLREQINKGLFREDLYHRLNVVPVQVPALIQRKDDIPILVKEIMMRISRSTGRVDREISEKAMNLLQAYDWPGNVRQLRNIVERLLILSPEEGNIDVDDLPVEILSNSAALKPTTDNEIMSLTLREAREKFETEYMKIQISRFNGNISKTAKFVGMERSALHRKLKGLGLTGHDKD